MPKITGVLATSSKLGDTMVGSRIDRTARDSMRGEFTSPYVRVVVEMLADGSTLVSTFRLGEGADATDTDRIIWNDDASVRVPATPERATEVTTVPHTFLRMTEQLGF